MGDFEKILNRQFPPLNVSLTNAIGEKFDKIENMPIGIIFNEDRTNAPLQIFVFLITNKAIDRFTTVLGNESRREIIQIDNVNPSHWSVKCSYYSYSTSKIMEENLKIRRYSNIIDVEIDSSYKSKYIYEPLSFWLKNDLIKNKEYFWSHISELVYRALIDFGMLTRTRGRIMRISRRDLREKKQIRKKVRQKRIIKHLVSSVLVLCIMLLVVFGVFYYYRTNKVMENIYDEIEIGEVQRIRTNNESVLVGESPISVLILGIDTGAYDRTEVGRADVLMVATINPDEKKAKLLSIPRDTYTEIVGNNVMDKINHAYAFGGISMVINSVQKLLDIPIDYYISIDMGGFTQLIDEVGGLTITPIETFEQEGFYFQENVVQKMDGETVLQYVRNRFTETGDYGRQARSRQVLETLISQLLNMNILINLNTYLGILEGHMSTNFKMNELQSIGLDITTIAKNLEILKFESNGEMIDGIYYEIIRPESLTIIQKELKNSLELE